MAITQIRSDFSEISDKSFNTSSTDIKLGSNKYKVAPLDSICLNVRLIPSRSIASVASRIPAVSINLTHTSPMAILSSMASRVVPAISETMAFSSLIKALNNVLFPALGLPAKTNANPFFKAFPSVNESLNSSTFCLISVTRSLNSDREANSTSSSPKSNSSSIREVKCNRRSRKDFISSENPPLNCFKAFS